MNSLRHKWFNAQITSDKDDVYTVVDYRRNQSTNQTEVSLLCHQTQKIWIVGYSVLLSNKIRTPYTKTVHGIGYFGEGKYLCRGVDGKITDAYCAWSNMLKRCYSKKLTRESKWYKNCCVCDDWHNFQTFAKWYEAETVKFVEHGVKPCLDKDLFNGRKGYLYSPDTCVILPHEINCLLFKKQKDRVFPEGVCLAKGKYKYKVQLSKHGKTSALHYTDCLLDASTQYKKEKIAHLKNLITIYKNVLSPKTVSNLTTFMEIYENSN